MAQVNLENIRKSFGSVKVLHGVNLNIQSGEFVSLLGSSGCGKTTLLRIVAGLETVTSGSISLDGINVTEFPPERRDIAMMFQSYALLPHLNVAENVRFPLRMRKIGNRDEQNERVKQALETVQLAHLSDRKPRQLSGGQQQRVALARAIVSKPKVLLLDEPLSNLDARLREDMQVELIEIHKRLGLTTLFVTHDQEEALSLSDRVVLLNGGHVEQEGTPAQIYSYPKTMFASSFLGAANTLKVKIEDNEQGPFAVLQDGQKLRLSKNETTRGDAMLILRQEDLQISSQSSADIEQSLTGLRAEIRTRVYLGARSRYVLRLCDSEIRILSNADDNYERGATVILKINPERIRIIAQ